MGNILGPISFALNLHHELLHTNLKRALEEPLPEANEKPRIKWFPLEREVADEWVQQHAMQTRSGRACTKCCSQSCKDVFCSTRLANRCYCIVPGLFIVATILLCIFIAASVTHFTSASYKKAASYKTTTCTVSSIEDQEVMKCSSPGKSRNSETICLKINVQYERDDGRTVEGLLRVADEAGLGAACTYALCRYDNLVNNTQVIEGRASVYRLTRTFSCLYDPAKGSTDIVRWRINTDDGPVIQKMVWPSLLILLGIGCILFMYHTCGPKYACTYYEPPQDVVIIAGRLRSQGVIELRMLPVEERKRLLKECALGPADFLSDNYCRF